MTHPMNGAAAICGLGITEMGRVYRDAEDLAAEAVYLALADAGLPKSELDGLMINAGVTNGVSIPLHISLGLRELNVLIESVPSNLLARLFNFTPAEYFALAEPEEGQSPKLEF